MKVKKNYQQTARSGNFSRGIIFSFLHSLTGLLANKPQAFLIKKQIRTRSSVIKNIHKL
jgi:hypothetical protein